MKIVPSVLAEDRDDFVLRMRQAEDFAEYVQIDVMDGVFVDTMSFPPESINMLTTPLAFEMHLMVMDPADIVKRLRHPGLRKIIFHFEARVDHHDLAIEIKRMGLSAGLAARPETALDVSSFLKLRGTPYAAMIRGRFPISRKWLQFYLKQIENLLLIVIGSANYSARSPLHLKCLSSYAL